MPIIQRNTTSLSNLVYTTGIYINPNWIVSLAAGKVGSGTAQWNASQLQGYPIYTGVPSSGQVLSWTSSGWFPSGVTGSAVATGVTSFNSRTGVVTLTSGDVTGALTYTPYNSSNPAGYISSGYYTANSGISLSGSNFKMGGTGTLDELDFSGPVKIRSAGSDIIIGQNAASDNGYFNNNSISIGTDAGSNSTYGENTFIGHYAGKNSTGGNTISIGTYAGYNSNSDTSIYIGQGAGITANGDYAIEISYIGGTATRISNDYDIHIQDVIGGNTSTRRLSFGNITMTPDANVEAIATESTTVPFIAKGAVSQTANLIEARSSSNSPLFYVDSGGYISTPSSGLATWNASQLQGYAVSSGYAPSSGQFLYYDGSGWIPESISVVPSFTTNYVDFNPMSNPPAYHEGRVFYDNASHTLAYYNNESGVTLNIGQENYIYVRNIDVASGVSNGQCVYINGSNGQLPTVQLARADDVLTSEVIGVATMDIPHNGYGYITTQGIVHDLNTNSYNDGDIVYLSPTTSGAFTSTRPLPPYYPVKVGIISYKSPNHGSLLVNASPQYALGNSIIGDVYIRNSGNLFTGNVLLNGAVSGTLATTGVTEIDSTPYASGDCIKYIVRTKYSGAIHVSEILLASDGSDTYMTEYAQVYTSGSLITFSADYNSSNIRLLGQAAHANTAVHMMKVLIA